MTTKTITRSLSDHGCTWPASRSYDRNRFAVSAAVRSGALAVEGGRLHQAVALMIPATKRHPGTHVWSPPT